MAFVYFHQKKCDWVVLEIGMGGRLDATNICDPKLSIITNVSLEHTLHLGNTIEKIAYEKAGIMRKNKPVVCGCNNKQDFEALEKLAYGKCAPFYCISDKYSIISKDENSLNVKFSFLHDAVAKINSSANYQAKNCACASFASHLLGIDAKTIISGLEKTSLDGRWQTISKNPKIIIDCAHNLGAFYEIEQMLKAEFRKNKDTVLFCAMKDKPYCSEIELLSKYFKNAIFCSLPFERAQSASELEKCAKSFDFENTFSFESAQVAFKHAKKITNNNSKLLVCGSIYLLQELFGESNSKIMG
jgi:dihydrofolate synthase/folylpolyglutamate synthase